eukprot:360150-Pelagomonas_calceolata.AAC.18
MQQKVETADALTESGENSHSESADTLTRGGEGAHVTHYKECANGGPPQYKECAHRGGTGQAAQASSLTYEKPRS